MMLQTYIHSFLVLLGRLLLVLSALFAHDLRADQTEPPSLFAHDLWAGQKNWYRPILFTTWQIQLQGMPNTTYSATLYTLDLFDTPKEVIDTLHAEGKKVICYFSAGSFEDWRPDHNKFKPAVLGEPLAGWPGERWLDIRSDNVRSIMRSRLDLAKKKGCDAVDPDNVDAYTQDTGFDLNDRDQLVYNRFLARSAHARGLSVGLKNDLLQIKNLVNDFDFAINERCHEYLECNLLTPFINAGKPVFNLEYQNKYAENEMDRFKLCEDSIKRGFTTLVAPPLLDGSFRYACH